MSIFKRLFGKKKSEESDGQEEFFKEDFAPVIKRSPSTKHDKIYVEPLEEVNKEKKKEVAAKERERRPVHQAKKPERSSNSKVVKPVPKSERIIHPSSARSKSEEPNPVAKQKVQESKPVVKVAKKEVKASKPIAKAKSNKPIASTELSDDSPEVKGAIAVQEGRATPNGKFNIQRSRDGRYFFTLYASNHAPIAYSQLYSSSSGATTGINSIIANSQRAEIEDKTLKTPTSLPCPKWEIYLDKAQQYRFRLYAPNGQCVCHASHGYSTKSGCKGGIESIKRFSAEAKVDKSYLK